MLERAELALKIACAVLVAVLLYEAAHLAKRFNPLRGVNIPAVPTLAGSTNAPGTNATSAASGGTNAAPGKAGGTNVTTAQKTGSAGTNIATAKTNTVTGQTNVVASHSNAPGGSTNALISQKSGDTNASAVPMSDTNINAAMRGDGPPANAVRQPTSPRSGTNVVLDGRSGEMPTNIVLGPGSRLPDSNLLALAKAGGTNTNVLATMKAAGAGTNAPPLAGGGRRGASSGARAGGPRGRGPELPPEAKKRVDWVVRSETLAPIIRPQPMGLLGIAGDRAFIRAPSGQTDMVKEGDTLGGIKLVKIGTNRVLVEEDGQPKELMIYEGYGGESLLPKQPAKTNETSATLPRSTASLSPAEAK